MSDPRFDTWRRLSSEDRDRLDRICDAFEERFEKGDEDRFRIPLDDLSDSAREIYIEEVVTIDAELRRKRGEQPRVEDYLSRFPGDVSSLTHLFADETSPVRGPEPPEDRERTVGPYRLLEKIGEGGMGVVYLAEQREPVRRRVALKLIKPRIHALDLDQRQLKEIIARFEAERQALALMNHPGIARIHDAGTTDDGRPYFAMELVEGVPIIEYCDQNRLSVRKRLELFLQVCQAIQHAHHRGVIHRDIKPSNILVTTPDTEAVAKIIDFGVARATNQRLTEKTMYTEVGRVVGTLTYMSPEQASNTPAGVDHRADIYSLGAVLYELLVGNLPLDLDVQTVSYDEVLRRIREDDPVTPSIRWSRLNSERTTRLASERRTSSLNLSSELRGEIDWICMKALEKDRGRRYETARQLGEDVERYLKSEPILARPAGAVYRTRKYLRKNRGPVTAAAALLATFAVGLIVSVLFAVKARRNATEASENATLAANNEEDAKSRLAEVLRLSDVKNLADARAAADQLWPASSANASRMREWLEHRARPLLENLPVHRQTLESLRERALERVVSTRRTWEFEDARDAWWHATLAELVAGLEAFRKTVTEVEARLGVANTLRQRTLEERRREWDQAVASIRSEIDCPMYGGLVLSPQEGLVPIGRDPTSRLWEFAHVQSGDIPGRDDSGKLILTEKTGIVLVLLPGGTFAMGAVRPRLGIQVRETDDAALIETVTPGELADRIGVLSGDVLWRINGTQIRSREDVRTSLESLATGAAVEVEVTRDARRRVLSGTVGPNVDPLAQDSDGPVHDVTLAPFFMSKFEMTQGQWLHFTGKRPSYYDAGVDFSGNVHTFLHPVEQVSWTECDVVLRRLDLLIPSDAQWEYAARAGTRTPFWTGSDRKSLGGKVNLADRAAVRAGAPWPATRDWPDLDDGFAAHAPVGTYAPNAFGLHDVTGNVFEWCRDWYASYRQPVAPGDGLRRHTQTSSRTTRGGGFNEIARYARSAFRNSHSPEYRGNAIGVRPSRGINP